MKLILLDIFWGNIVPLKVSVLQVWFKLTKRIILSGGMLCLNSALKIESFFLL